MADLLLAEERTEPSSLEIYLREALPDQYVVVAGPTVYGRPLDTVVVCPWGLVVLHAKDWQGEIRPVHSGPWHGRLPSGEQVRHPNPVKEARQATKALRAFLNDEFPGLVLTIRHLLVLTDPEVTLTMIEAVAVHVVPQNALVGEFQALELADGSTELAGEAREALALALQARRLTASQRAGKPFVFRSGGLLGSGKKVWTVRAAVQHMDAHPDDGIYHLRNGTLAQWLSEQGVEHVAELAREVVRTRDTDPRVPLETFCIGTGLVRRPRLSVWPKRVNLGCALSGESCGQRIRIRKGRGRGYLFGSLRSADPWLRVDPRSFSGRPVEVVATVDTGTLPIGGEPWRSELLVQSSASATPVSVPVRVRVVGMPSQFSRRLVRPLVGALSAALLGEALGWSLGQWGTLPQSALGTTHGPAVISPKAWTALVGLAWAILGGIRGWFQPPAWPITYATGRWLLRTLVWGGALVVLAVAGRWALHQLDLDYGAVVGDVSLGSVALLALALAILPAVVEEIRASRQARTTKLRPARSSLLRPILLAGLGMALVLALLGGVLFIGPAWQHPAVQLRFSSAEQWAGEQWSQLDARVNGLVDQLYVRYYDRRVPVPTVVPLTTPARVPGAGAP